MFINSLAIRNSFSVAGKRRPSTCRPNGPKRAAAAEKATVTVKQPVLRLIIAGGGTGGHLFPGIAIAEETMARNAANRVLFIGTGNPFESNVLDSRGFCREKLKVQGIKGMGVLKQLGAVLKLPAAIRRSIAILKTFRPNLVLGLGGYSSGPVVISAWLLRIPSVLHEQNVLPGITNRLLSLFANRIYVSFENTRLQRFKKKLRITGNPVRREFLESLKAEALHQGAQGLHTHFTVMVVGGSQGAHGINTAVVEALPHLSHTQRYQFIHQTGAADEVMVRQAYSEHRISAEVASFFNDMAGRYRRADLVICRAGATTIAELTLMGKGVVFIPFPYAADDHQALNAAGLVSRKAAEMIREQDLSGKLLAQKIESFAAAPENLAAMAQKAKKMGRPQAAAHIVDDMIRLIGFEDSRIQGVE
jgi:UDP-N-acetylglucosamine--N-acetylmuramyl-(pentapeptide) pyrophosphoryl-undecaprenol N-acetylglucosamine transferase